MRPGAAAWLAALVLALVCALHLGSILHYAVDVPFEDEWSLVEDLERPLPWGLLKRFNEHRHAYTRLQGRVLYRTVRWNRRWACALNALILIATAGATLAFLWLRCPQLPRPLAPLLLIPWFSRQGWENYLWGMQSHFVLANLLVLAICVGLFARAQRTWVLALSGLLAAAACQVTSGVVGSCALLLLWFACFKLARVRAGESARRELLQLAGVAVLFALGVIAWRAGWTPRPDTPEPVLPVRPLYWKFMAWAAAAGAGFARPTWPAAILATALAVLPLLLILKRQEADPRTWACAAPALCAIGAMAAIGYGRGHHPLAAAISRYFHTASFAWPFLVAAWFELSPQPTARLSRTKLRTLGWAAALLCVASLDDFGSAHLARAQQARREAKQQLQAAYQDPDRSVRLQERYTRLRNATWERIDHAKRLGVSGVTSTSE